MYPEEQQFNDYIAIEPSGDVTMDAPESQIENELCTGSISWTITKVLSWKIMANGEYGFSFKIIFDANTMTS